MTTTKPPSYWALISYFVPLALQTILQSFSYPLVAVIASRAEGGALNTAGLMQSSAVIGLLWALGNGMLTAGMVYANSREGYQRFCQVNNWIISGVVLVYLILLLPPSSRLIFDRLLGLPPSVAAPARRAFLFSLPMTVLFFMRTPFMVLMWVRKFTAQAFIAALLRIAAALALTPVFCWLKLTGVFWAVVCLTVSVGVETIFLRYFVRPIIAQVPSGATPPPRLQILGFVLTLSIGAMLLSLSGFMLAAFIARAPDPERMLPVYSLVFAVVGLLMWGAVRIQTLTLAFYSDVPAIRRRIFGFAVAVGWIAGLTHLVLLEPRLLVWYYSRLQGLPIGDLGLVKETSLAMVLFSPAVALRSYVEGVAAYYKKPMLVLTGQAIYLGMVATFAFFAVNLGMPGNLIGPFTLVVANSAGAGVIYLALWWEKRTDLPVPETTTSSNLR